MNYYKYKVEILKFKLVKGQSTETWWEEDIRYFTEYVTLDFEQLRDNSKRRNAQYLGMVFMDKDSWEKTLRFSDQVDSREM